MKIVFLFLASSVLALETQSCSQLVCGSTGTSSSGPCVTVSGSTVTLNPCPNNSECQGLKQFYSISDKYDTYESSTCEPTSTETISCPTEHDGSLGTYDYCCAAGDCASNSCDVTNHHCLGIAEGGSCTSSEECEKDLYCSGGTTGTCVAVKKSGDSCIYSYECKAGYGCLSGLCTQYWSLSNGASSSSDNYCKSGNSINGKCDSLQVKVVNDYVTEPWSCSIGNNCVFSWILDGSTYTTAKCVCDGTGSSQTGYCHIGEAPYINGFDDSFYEKFQYSSSDCAGDYAHITDLSEDLETLVACNSIDQDGYSYYVSMSQIRYAWSLYQSGQIDNCANEMNIFNPNDDMGSWSGAELLAYSAILILFN